MDRARQSCVVLLVIACGSAALSGCSAGDKSGSPVRGGDAGETTDSAADAGEGTDSTAADAGEGTDSAADAPAYEGGASSDAASSDAGPADGAPADGGLVPAVTGVGTVADDGMPTTATIGSSGGTLVADSGRVSLAFPAGALAQDTQITVTPIENTAPNGVTGHAYRFEPNGLTFAQPITVTLTASDADTEGSTFDAIGASTQDSAGRWRVLDVTRDDTAKTVQFTTTHFSDYAYTTTYELGTLAGTATFLGGGVELDLLRAPGLQSVIYPDTIVYYQPYPSQYGPPLGIEWAVNGQVGGDAAHGTIEPLTASSAQYTAPTAFPSDGDPVVTARFTDDAGTLWVLVAPIRLLAHQYAFDFTFAETYNCGASLLTFALTTTTQAHFTLDDQFQAHFAGSDAMNTPFITGFTACDPTTFSVRLDSNPQDTQGAFVSNISGGYRASRNRLRLLLEGTYQDNPSYYETQIMPSVPETLHVEGQDPMNLLDYFTFFTGYPDTLSLGPSTHGSITSTYQMKLTVETPLACAA